MIYLLISRRTVSNKCLVCYRYCNMYSDVSQTFLLPGPFWFHKVNMDPHMRLECPDDRHPKLKICISELILGKFKYIPLGYTTMRCII